MSVCDLSTCDKASHAFLWNLRGFSSPVSAGGPQLSSWFLSSPPTPSPDFFLLNEAIQLSPNFCHKHSRTLSKTGLSLERRVLTIVAYRRPHFPHSYPKWLKALFLLGHLVREIVTTAVPLQVGCGTHTPASSLHTQPRTWNSCPWHFFLSVASCVYPFLTYNQAKCIGAP